MREAGSRVMGHGSRVHPHPFPPPSEGEGGVRGSRFGPHERESSLKGWFYVCGLALFFLLYGLFMFYMIGDKGPPGWDFGTVEDIPGASVFSTNEPITGGTAAPEPQHVSQKPPQADIAGERDKP